ncbi:hypothetical protein COOONC_15136 [Cooperia oncophora]
MEMEYSKRLKKSSFGIGTIKNAKQVLRRKLPVARHYIRGHGQLLKLFEAVNRPISLLFSSSLWCSAHLTVNFITIYKIVCYMYSFDYDITRVNKLWKPTMLCFLLVFIFLQSTYILQTALKLRRLIVGLSGPMMRVAACDRLPHEQLLLFSGLSAIYCYSQHN